MGQVVHIHRTPEAPSAWRGTGFAHVPDRPSRAALRAHRRAARQQEPYSLDIILMITVGLAGVTWMLAKVAFTLWAAS